MSDESHEKGRKMSMWKGPAQKPGGVLYQITDARTNNIVLYSKLTPPPILASNSH
jgi:hypothetical protein